MEIKKLARQGDLLFVKVKKIPAEARKTDDPILAHGEVTGHAHRVINTPLAVIFDFEKTGAKFLRSETPIEIGHEEHGALNLERGDWEVRRQREYFPEGIKRVQD